MSVNESSRKARREKLDQAVRDYIQDGVETGDFSPGGIVVGWVMGIAISRVTDEGEFDNHLVESNPGINNFMARGLADATAEAFAYQSTAAYSSDDDDE